MSSSFEGLGGRRSIGGFLTIIAAVCALLLTAGSARAYDGGQISAGLYHSCGVFNGAAKCWGQNPDGQLGNGALGSNQLLPVQVIGMTSGVTAVAAGDNHSCAIKDGGAWCWGNGYVGQLGDNMANTSTVPVAVVGLDSGVTAITVGGAFSCAIQNGRAKCWGNNYSGQLGNGDGDYEEAHQPVNVISGLASGVTDISAGDAHACAVVNGVAKCWGDNSRGQLGNGYAGTGQQQNVAVFVSDWESGVTDIAAGDLHTCAVKDGAAKCWGWGESGQLGRGSSSDSSNPVQVTDLASGVVSVTAGNAFSCAVVAGGGARCWGYNGYAGDDGRLGDGTIEQRTTPVEVVGLGSGVTTLVAGKEHTCAVVAGYGKCWGVGHSGQLGSGIEKLGEPGVGAPSSVPVQVVGFVPPTPIDPGGGDNPEPPAPPAASNVAPSLGVSGKAKVKGKNVSFSSSVRLAIPNGFTPAEACTGKISAQTKPKGVKKAVKTSGALKASGATCNARLSFKLPKKFKGKKVKLKLTFPGNAAFQAFSRTSNYKIR